MVRYGIIKYKEDNAMKQSLDTRTKLLTQNPVSLMFELSIPAILGMVVVGLYNFMDSVFVGRWSDLYRWELSRYPIPLP